MRFCVVSCIFSVFCVWGPFCLFLAFGVSLPLSPCLPPSRGNLLERLFGIFWVIWIIIVDHNMLEDLNPFEDAISDEVKKLSRADRGWVSPYTLFSGSLGLTKSLKFSETSKHKPGHCYHPSQQLAPNMPRCYHVISACFLMILPILEDLLIHKFWKTTVWRKTMGPKTISVPTTMVIEAVTRGNAFE